jgi:hypothetical protein
VLQHLRGEVPDDRQDRGEEAVASFASGVSPTTPELVAVVEKALAAR